MINPEITPIGAHQNRLHRNMRKGIPKRFYV